MHRALLEKNAGPNQRNLRVRLANTMPTHASFIDHRRAATFTLYCSLHWHDVGRPDSWLLLIGPGAFAGKAQCICWLWAPGHLPVKNLTPLQRPDGQSFGNLLRSSGGYIKTCAPWMRLSRCALIANNMSACTRGSSTVRHLSFRGARIWQA